MWAACPTGEEVGDSYSQYTFNEHVPRNVRGAVGYTQAGTVTILVTNLSFGGWRGRWSGSELWAIRDKRSEQLYKDQGKVYPGREQQVHTGTFPASAIPASMTGRPLGARSPLYFPGL